MQQKEYRTMTKHRIHRTITWLAGLIILAVLPACRSGGNRADTRSPNHVAEAIPAAQPSMNPVVEIDTSLGSFRVTLDAYAAPVTVMNFVDYANAGFYNGTIFHRVINSTMIQGGAMTPSMKRKTVGLRDPIINEWDTGLKNKQWTIGMVRRPGVFESAQAEFYINLVDHAALDMPTDGSGYCAFGIVTSGFDTIERIRNTPVGPHPDYADGRSAVVPVKPVVIESIRVIGPLDREKAEARAAELDDLRRNGVQRMVEKYEAESHSKAVRSDTGLIYIDLVVGKGATPDENSNVEATYTGWFINGAEFESQIDKPVLWQVPNLIAGLKEGILTMAEGGRRAIIVPPELAYGSGGIPGKIPPNSTLVYEVDLLEIK